MTTVADPFKTSELVSSLISGLIVSDVAFVVLHDNVTVCPATTDVEFALNSRVGAPPWRFWIGFCELPPPPPHPARIIIKNNTTE